MGGLRLAAALGMLTLLIALPAKAQLFIAKDTVVDNDRGETGFIVGYANQLDFTRKTNGVSVTLTLTDTAKIHSAGAFNSSVINSSGALESPSGGLGAHDNAVVNISAGFVYFVDALDKGTINMSGGRTNFARFYGSSTGNIGNAIIGDPGFPNGNTYLEARELSTVTLSQTQILDQLRAINSSKITATDATVGQDVKSLDLAAIKLTGGRVGRDLIASQLASINGTSVTVDGSAVADTGAKILLQNGSVGNFVRANGGIIGLSGVVVGKDVLGNGAISIVGGVVNGSVIKNQFGDLGMTGGKVVGDVIATTSGVVGIDGTTVGRNLTIWSGSVANAHIQGNLSNAGNQFGGRIDVSGITLDGDLLASGESTFYLASGHVAGDAEVGNGSIEMTGGTIAGNFNSSRSATIAGGNVVGDFHINGGSADMKGGLVEHNVSVAAGTTLRLSGGTVAGNIDVQTNGFVNMSGGEVKGNLNLFPTTNMILSGGTIAGNVNADGEGIVSLGGGNINGSLLLGRSRQARISGGAVEEVEARDSNTVTISGDSAVRTLQAFNGSEITVNGGSIFGGAALASGSSMAVDNGNLGVIEVRDGASLLIDNTQSGGIVRTAAIRASGNAQVTVTGPKDLFISELQTDGSSVALLNGGDFELGVIAFGGSVKVTDGAVIRTSLEARNGATVEMDAGTVFGAIDLYERSVLEMSGGTVNGNVVGHDRSQLIIGRAQMDQVRTEQESTLDFGNAATARKLQASGTGGIVMSGGTVTTDVEGTDQTTVVLSGLANVVGNVLVDKNVRLVVNGGQVQKNVVARDFSQVFMDGGRIFGSVLLANTATFQWTGGTIGGLGPLPPHGLLAADNGGGAAAPLPDPLTILISADDAAAINIYGTDLQAELIDATYQDRYSLYRLSGTLADRGAIGGAYFAVQNGTGASYHLLPPSAIPEPGAMLLAVGLAVVLRFASIRGRTRPGTTFPPAN